METIETRWCICFPHDNGMVPCLWLCASTKSDAYTRAIKDSIVTRNAPANWRNWNRRCQRDWLKQKGYMVLPIEIRTRADITQAELEKKLENHYGKH